MWNGKMMTRMSAARGASGCIQVHNFANTSITTPDKTNSKIKIPEFPGVLPLGPFTRFPFATQI